MTYKDNNDFINKNEDNFMSKEHNFVNNNLLCNGSIDNRKTIMTLIKTIT